MSKPVSKSHQNSESSFEPDIRRVPPNNQDAERSILGSVLVKPAAFEEVSSIVKADDFYSPPHRAIFEAMTRAVRKQKSPDLLNVSEQLLGMGKLAEAGGQLYLAELASGVVGATMATEHARIVRSLATRRGLIDLGMRLVEDGFDPASEPMECAKYTTEIDSVIHGEDAEAATVMPADYIDGYMADMERLQQAGGLAGVPTPWDGLNRYTAGFVPGEITVLAGRSGTGKTAMAMNVVEHAARNGYTVGVLSLEMTRHALTNRFMASGAQVDAQKFRNARLDADDWRKLYGYADVFGKLPVLICDKREIRPSQLRAMCRKWKRDKGLSLLVVDYLQLMQPETRDKVREREVSEISRALKLLAVDLEIPVLVLAQLNREAEKEKRPRLSHLRESGAIEQDADIILFIVPWKTQDAGDNVEITIDVAKGRNNATGDAKLVYRRKYLRFESLAPEYMRRAAVEHDAHWTERS